jgi:hypothetical protein
MWIWIAGVIVLLFFVLRGVKHIKQAGRRLVGVMAFMVPFYFILKPLILSAFLLLNTLGNKTVDKQYAASFFLEEGKKKPMLYDLSTQKIISKNIEGLEKVQKRNTGDIVTVTFQIGYLGYYFNPRVK